MLILAGITISYVMGENSIFKLAQEAKDKTDNAIKDEKDYFNYIENTLNEYANGNGGGNTPSGPVDVSTITDKVDKNTPAKDSLGNPITIPEGFHVVPDGQDGVEYNYTGDKKPTVQDGIVIADDENNQFVWIPVGSIKNKDNTTTTIQLARYTFDIGTYDSTTKTYNGTGKETLVQNADNYTETVTIGNCYQELSSSDEGNTTAKNLGNFVTNTQANGGYYLARYEASKGADNKVKSKSAAVWNNLTQPEAATAARGMYTSNSFESDLVNSYAWDTAIVFIQAYSGDNDYSKEVGPTFSSSLVNTGTNGDKRCNIYDMASNIAEWTTETCADVYGPCTVRGGSYDDSIYCTAVRSLTGTSNSGDSVGFRATLYISSTEN